MAPGRVAGHGQRPHPGSEYRHNHSNGSGGWHEAYCYKETNCGTNHGRPLLCVHDRHYCGGSYSADGCGDLDWTQVPV